MDFIEFPKMARLSRNVIISEKLDGTNATIYIEESDRCGGFHAGYALSTDNGFALFAGSKNRWINPENDNYGFARWCKQNSEDLFELGPGWHRGEWWGQGIQRGYGLTEKRYSLFNADRWCSYGKEPQQRHTNDPRVVKMQDVAPACCHVVPVLHQGIFDTTDASNVLNVLKRDGSRAVPGFMRPEGIVIWHTAGQVSFKKTIEKDESPKSL